VCVKLHQDRRDIDIYHAKCGDRIAQAMIVPVDRCEFIESNELTQTDRGVGGFGSTGK
jgi:dUTP pyrophosphatase